MRRIKSAKKKRIIRVDTIFYDEIAMGNQIGVEVEQTISEMESRKDAWTFLSAFTTTYFGKQQVHLIFSQSTPTRSAAKGKP